MTAVSRQVEPVPALFADCIETSETVIDDGTAGEALIVVDVV